MEWTFDSLVDLLCAEASLLKKSKHGLEKESLRCSLKGELSLSPHPKALGAPLFHPYITLDYSEAQLELVTPPLESEEEALGFLEELHRAIHAHLEGELLWPFSSPCELPEEEEIPLAGFGALSRGRIEKIYRRGLALRYGKKMQTLSGLHYNFSLSKELWERLYRELGRGEGLSLFISEGYLHIVRNYLREGWLLDYLFGASPAVDASYLSEERAELARYKERTLYAEFATSLRMSRIGYYSKVRSQAPIDFDSLEVYLRGLSYALSHADPHFKEIGTGDPENPLQLNTFYFQRESEHYARIRPKPRCSPGERPLETLKREGIDYLEVRALDLSPFSPIGVERDQLFFLHLFLLYCLCRPSLPLEREEKALIVEDKERVAYLGRKPGLCLRREGREVGLRQWGEEIVQKLQPLAALLDGLFGKACYRGCLRRQQEKLADASKTPSARVLRELFASYESLLDYGVDLAAKQQRGLLASRGCPRLEKEIGEAGAASLSRLKREELMEACFLKGYEDLELSTQMVIREALKRGVEVELLDRRDNFIRLKKEGKVELVKQGNKTSKDSYIAFLTMENKAVSKLLLEEEGIRVPQGELFYQKEEALKNFFKFSSKKVVIKPNFTNYGIGVAVVGPEKREAYERAVETAFSFSDEVVIEEFIEGEEYRFLIIGEACEAVCKREPAHVVGDGALRVFELVDRKNARKLLYPIQKGEEERAHLLEQGLDWDAVPERGRRVLLRKISNVSTGGDPIDQTDEMGEGFKKIALRAARKVGALFCGVDMIVKEIAEEPGSLNHAVIELNFNPALFLHRYPFRGKPRFVERAVLDQLGF